MRECKSVMLDKFCVVFVVHLELTCMVHSLFHIRFIPNEYLSGLVIQLDLSAQADGQDKMNVKQKEKSKPRSSGKSRSLKNRQANHESLNVSCSTMDEGLEEHMDTLMNEELEASDSSNKPLRRSNSRVTFAPEPEKLSAEQPQGFRADYSLGERIRSESHMFIEQSPDLAHEAVNALRKNDYAFVKRSDGAFSYAKVVDRYTKGNHEVLVFMVNSSKSTKRFPSKLWSKFIRCVAPSKNETRSLSSRYKMKRRSKSSHNNPADASDEYDSYHVSPTCVRETLSSRATRFARTFEVLTSSMTSGTSSGISSSARSSMSAASSITDMVYHC